MKFVDLSQRHREIEQIFRLHQLALIERKFDEARGRLSEFAHAVALHAMEEEGYVVPAWILCAGEQTGASLETLRGEHAKIGELLAATLDALGASPRIPSSEELLWILEREHRLLSLLTHHFLRVETVIYPALDRSGDVEEKERLFQLLAHGTSLTAPAPQSMLRH